MFFNGKWQVHKSADASKAQNTQHLRVMERRYKSKYKKLKGQIKMFAIENAALCDEVSEVQAELCVAREERRYLLQRLLKHEGIERLEEEEAVQQQVAELAAKANPVAGPKKRGPKKRPQIKGDGSGPTGKGAASENNKLGRNQKHRNQMRIDAAGKPIFPINLFSILIHSAGEIITANPNFHSTNWIYPVGYVATRIYANPNDPQRKCVFTCKILNNAGNPMFLCIPDNDLDSVFFGDSANSCHRSLLDTLQRSLSDSVKLPMHVQGEKFFGLANATVRSLLQMDPGLKDCVNFKGFVEPDKESGGLQTTEESDPTINFDALQSLIVLSAYHTMPEVREEPPDELLNFN